jgi:phosphoribosyl 1,2-cyclic phosphodiesterase
MTKDGIVSYVSDSELVDEVIEAHKGARVLIMCVTRPLGTRVRYHLSTEDAAMLTNEIKPEVAVMTHFGSKFVHEGPEKQAKYVQEESGIRTIAAMDFMRLTVLKGIRRGMAQLQK